MLAARYLAYGPPESVVIEELPDPVPGPGEVVVDIAAAAVNFPDVLIGTGQYQVRVPPPFTPGSEFAGTVRSVGTGVTRLRPGDRVRGGAMVGCFAEQILVPEASLELLPAGIDLADAAGYHVVYATAFHALRSVAEVGNGDWVVVLGAAGGVGLAAVELAQIMGARVVAAASSDPKLEVCRMRGAERLINDTAEDLKEAIRTATDGAGADVVIDPVGGPYAEAALRSTRWGGRFVTVGFASGEIPRIPLNLVLLKGVIVKGFEIRTFSQHAPEQARRDEEELQSLFSAGRIHPYVSAVFPLEKTADALRAVADRQAIGKVLIKPARHESPGADAAAREHAR